MRLITLQLATIICISLPINMASAEGQDKGKQLFGAKACGTCHSLGSKKAPHHIGPPLKGVTQQREKDWLLKLLLKPEEMQQNDPIAKDLMIQYNNVPMPNLGLTQEEAESLYQFLLARDLKAKIKAEETKK